MCGAANRTGSTRVDRARFSAMIIRSMVPADAEAIHAIHGMCLQRTLLGRYTREQIEAWMAGRTPQGYLRAAEAGERFFVADEGGAVVGYASWQEDELLSLFVHPDCQRTGIGSALLSACFDDAARINATISIVKSVLVPKSSMAVMAS